MEDKKSLAPIRRQFRRALDTIVAVALIALILLALYLTSDAAFTPKTLRQLAQDILPNLISVPIVYLVVRYFQAAWSEMEAERFTQVLTSKIADYLTGGEYQEKAASALARQLSKEKYHGIVAVHESLEKGPFKRYIKEAERGVTILNTWIPDLTEYSAELIATLRREIKVTILVLWPDSDAAGLRSNALRNLPGAVPPPHVRPGVENNLDDLRLIARGAGSYQKYLCVKVYNSLPSISAYCVDDRGFVSLFLHDRLAIKSPQFEFHGVDTGFGQHIAREVKTLEKIGIAFKDIENWRLELNGIAPQLGLLSNLTRPHDDE